MNVVDLSGRAHKINLYSYTGKPSNNKSQYHLKARKLLKEMFPTHPILEEIHVPGERLFLDFFLPLKRLVVEVHGAQHYELNNHFHANKLEFFKSKTRDSNKIRWCEINNIDIVTLPYDEDLNEWRNRITTKRTD
jgi:hypothetical protein